MRFMLFVGSILAAIPFGGCGAGERARPAAASPERLDLDVLASSADTLVVGTVLSVESRLPWAEGTWFRPATDVTLSVEDSAFPMTATLRFNGWAMPEGRLGHTIPRFHAGERYLLLPNFFDDDCPIVGCDQGLFRLQRGIVRGADDRVLWMMETGELEFGEVDVRCVPAGAIAPVEPAELISLARGAMRATDTERTRRIDQHFADMTPAIADTGGELPREEQP